MAHHASSNPNEFILPDLGEGVAEAELIKWRVKVGDVVKEHDILADMETDKALVEVPSPRGGMITGLNGAEGEIIKVGAVLVTFGDAKAAAKPAPAPAATPAPTPTPTPTLDRGMNTTRAEAAAACDMGSQIGSKVPTSNGTHGGGSSGGGDAGTVVGSVGGTLAGLSADGSALATPAVRRLARDMGVDINRIVGTGIGGRVTEKDVRGAATGGTAAPAPAPTPVARPAAVASAIAATAAVAAVARPAPTPVAAPVAAPAAAPAPKPAAVSVPDSAGSTRIPFRGVRRTIANRLRESVSQTVHFTVMDEADVTALEALRKKLASASGEKISFLPFVASAVCRCLAGEFKEFNSTTDDAKEEIVRHAAVHLGIATDTDNGLMVPVVRNCETLGVMEIGRAITSVAEGARNRTASRDALMGSTFTISNVGSHAGRFATPIINYPEVGILAVGRARDGVVVRQGAIAVGKVLPLSLACDHRVVDGASAALMLAKIVELLGKPEELLGPARG
jgi:pyruvate dehydrogenase E2 component (dihydrolipoamide acetyltransferase)